MDLDEIFLAHDDVCFDPSDVMKIEIAFDEYGWEYADKLAGVIVKSYGKNWR